MAMRSTLRPGWDLKKAEEGLLGWVFLDGWMMGFPLTDFGVFQEMLRYVSSTPKIPNNPTMIIYLDSQHIRYPACSEHASAASTVGGGSRQAPRHHPGQFGLHLRHAPWVTGKLRRWWGEASSSGCAKRKKAINRFYGVRMNTKWPLIDRHLWSTSDERFLRSSKGEERDYKWTCLMLCSGTALWMISEKCWESAWVCTK